jgi:hypothetical protein
MKKQPPRFLLQGKHSSRAAVRFSLSHHRGHFCVLSLVATPRQAVHIWLFFEQLDVFSTRVANPSATVSQYQLSMESTTATARLFTVRRNGFVQHFVFSSV